MKKLIMAIMLLGMIQPAQAYDSPTKTSHVVPLIFRKEPVVVTDTVQKTAIDDEDQEQGWTTNVDNEGSTTGYSKGDQVIHPFLPPDARAEELESLINDNMVFIKPKMDAKNLTEE